MMSEEAYDISRFTVPQPYDMTVAQSATKLRVDYVIDNDLIAIIPACRRAVMMAKDA